MKDENRDDSKSETQEQPSQGYYYDDSTGYEIYRPENEEEEASEELE